MTRLQPPSPADRSRFTGQAPASSATEMGPGLVLPAIDPRIDPADGIADMEFAALTRLAADLHASDCRILIRLIRRIAEMEQLFGEEVALAMLESAVVQADPLSRLF